METDEKGVLLQRASYLILRHLRDEITAPEQEELQAWIAASAENQRFFDQFKDEQQLLQKLQQLGSFDTDAAWEAFTSRHLPPAKVRTMPWKWVAAAAVVLIAGVYFWNQQKPAIEQTVVSELVNDVKPGTSKAILTLGDGSVVTLDSAGNKVIGQGIRQAGGQLEYGEQAAVSFNTLTTPKGGQFQITLADGTKIWLNAASSLRYPTAFAGGTRKVEVTGEAYFEVAKNAAMPFIVQINAQTAVEVLGTSFNINAYTNEASIKTTLIEGAVRLTVNEQSRTLSPGQQAQVNSQGEIRLVEKADLDEALAWKHEIFYFRNADLQAVMRQLERWYDVEISYSGKIPPRRFQGEIQRNLNLSDVLEGLKNTEINFSIEGRKIIVKP
ncbi:FecR family protein [Chitinophaga niabensis]|uniref:Ferric-dicitrate binding protein FerR, regulates iron transport through sigma-19 n=1 Tax=Chitinophaga niabensis TaxID=536979 RepID=A0A1N6DLE2_9BACT|nr:FecR family protein [Chitinophaga niabensis]SIN71641.1 ferric-dicitrate binding protein FerR, regulates iron transport through sigma-19 [Chitinophaga niabensis]